MICTPYEMLWGSLNEADWYGRNKWYVCCGKQKNIHALGSVTWKKLHGRPRHRRQDNILTDLKETEWEGVVRISVGTGGGLLRHGNEPAVSIKCWEFLEGFLASKERLSPWRNLRTAYTRTLRLTKKSRFACTLCKNSTIYLSTNDLKRLVKITKKKKKQFITRAQT